MVPADWHATARPYRHALVHELVAEAADRDPDAPALVTADRTVTHGELAMRSNQVAHFLRRLGIGPGDFVGLLSDHTPEAVVGLVGVLKAGAAYAPLDPRWPVARIHGLLDRLGVRAVLSDSAQLRRLIEAVWDLPALLGVVALDRTERESWRHGYDRDDVAGLWDFVAEDDDPLRAAGFNLRSDDFSAAEVEAYYEHVARLVLSQCPGHVLELGAGSGELARRLAPHVRAYTAVDPAPSAVAKCEQVPGVVAKVGYADEVAVEADLAVLSSTVQFLPGPDHLALVLDQLAHSVKTVVLADLVDPAVGDHPGLRVAPALLEHMVASSGSYASVEILPRDGALTGELGSRYDAILQVGAVSATERRKRIWTAWHLDRQPTTPVAELSTPDDLAYVIFTSGSTGVPKGVGVQHRPVANLIDWVNRVHDVGPADRLLFVTSFCFDLSVYDMFGVLAAGGSVRIVPDADLGEPDVLAEVLATEPITFWDSAPAAMSLALPFAPLHVSGAPKLRLVFLSGDWVPVGMPDEIRESFPAARIVQLGGATEAVVWSNSYDVHAVDPDWPSIPYGVPIQNGRYHVEAGPYEEAEVGEAGDLLIGGEVLSVGYVGDGRLTAAKFTPDPWGAPGARIYRTGDRSAWLPDGLLRFLGRLDHQVKIRGFRIELGDVQAALGAVPGVRESVVLAPDTPYGRILVGLFTGSATPASVRGALEAVLPEYMLPAQLIALPALPASATGKVDRAELTRAFLAGELL